MKQYDTHIILSLSNSIFTPLSSHHNKNFLKAVTNATQWVVICYRLMRGEILGSNANSTLEKNQY